MCEICVGICLCSADPAELDKAWSGRISVRWERGALSGNPIGILCSIVEDSDRRAEKILSKYEICVGLCLCSADPAELAKACSDRSSVGGQQEYSLGVLLVYSVRRRNTSTGRRR